jgi:hypothetical protein
VANASLAHDWHTGHPSRVAQSANAGADRGARSEPDCGRPNRNSASRTSRSRSPATPSSYLLIPSWSSTNPPRRRARQRLRPRGDRAVAAALESTHVPPPSDAAHFRPTSRRAGVTPPKTLSAKKPSGLRRSDPARSASQGFRPAPHSPSGPSANWNRSQTRPLHKLGGSGSAARPRGVSVALRRVPACGGRAARSHGWRPSPRLRLRGVKTPVRRGTISTHFGKAAWWPGGVFAEWRRPG